MTENTVPESTTTTERRLTFRITESAWVEHVIIEPSKDVRIDQLFNDADSFRLTTEIQVLDLEFESLFNGRNDLDPTTSDLIKLLNRKINAASALIAANNNTHQQQFITLSVEGLSFLNTVALAENEHIAIRLRLLSDHLGIVLKAKVVYSLQLDKQYRIGCQFIEVDDATQQLLNRHILGFQAQQKRAQQ